MSSDEKPTGTTQQVPGLISVVMPCYNAEAFVAEAVQCVLDQTYPHVQLIVIDDGSSDRSREILQAFGDRIVSLEQRNQGPYPARNYGLRNASGEFVAFLDADDLWSHDCLQKLHAALLDHTEAALVYCGWQNFGNGAPGGQPYIPPSYEEGDIVAQFLRSCPWPIHAALLRRETIDAVHGFSERYFSSMDYDLWLRIIGVTRDIVRVPEVLAFYRWHGSGQISATKWRQVLDAVRVRRDFVHRHADLIRHLPSEKLFELVDGQILKEAYRCYWRRDLANAHILFRTALFRRIWHANDLRYLLPALLPAKTFAALVAAGDRFRAGTS